MTIESSMMHSVFCVLVNALMRSHIPLTKVFTILTDNGSNILKSILHIRDKIRERQQWTRRKLMRRMKKRR